MRNNCRQTKARKGQGTKGAKRLRVTTATDWTAGWREQAGVTNPQATQLYTRDKILTEQTTPILTKQPIRSATPNEPKVKGVDKNNGRKEREERDRKKDRYYIRMSRGGWYEKGVEYTDIANRLTHTQKNG